MTGKPLAVLWDMDGTIIDSEPSWLAAEQNLAAEFGIIWTIEDAIKNVGSGLTQVAKAMQARGVKLPDDEIIERLTSFVADELSQNQPWRPGAVELMSELHQAGIPQVLVTMSYRKLAELVSSLLPAPVFSHIVSGDSVTHPKPHPEPYLVAAELLAVDINSCVAFEDSFPGVSSASAAGAVSFVIPNYVPVPEGENYTTLKTLAGFDLAQITSKFQELKNS